MLTTQKDWANIANLDDVPAGIILAYLAVEIRFVAGQDELTALINKKLAGRISRIERSRHTECETVQDA